jgi:hypothetical protein
LTTKNQSAKELLAGLRLPWRARPTIGRVKRFLVTHDGRAGRKEVASQICSAGFAKEERAFAVARHCARASGSRAVCAQSTTTRIRAIHAVSDELVRLGTAEPVDYHALLTAPGVSAAIVSEMLDGLTNYERVSKEAGYLYGLALGFTFARGGAR